jgi:hypothetical protein
MGAGFGLTADLTLAPVALRTPSEVAAPLGLAHDGDPDDMNGKSHNMGDGPEPTRIARPALEPPFQPDMLFLIIDIL